MLSIEKYKIGHTSTLERNRWSCDLNGQKGGDVQNGNQVQIDLSAEVRV